jgi:transposase-like protein
MYSDALQWTRVRRQVLTGVMSQREVAREHSIARSTVRKMVQISAPPGESDSTTEAGSMVGTD